MNPHNLFSLLTERLMLNANQLSMATYNVLFEVRLALVFLNYSSFESVVLYMVFPVLN